jgi:hypothetical protein
VFHLLEVELDQLHAYRHDWAKLLESLHKACDIGDPAVQGWREPAFCPAPIAEPWLPVPRFALPA